MVILMSLMMNVIKIINFVADKKGQTSVSNGKVKEEPVSINFTTKYFYTSTVWTLSGAANNS